MNTQNKKFSTITIRLLKLLITNLYFNLIFKKFPKKGKKNVKSISTSNKTETIIILTNFSIIRFKKPSLHPVSRQPPEIRKIKSFHQPLKASAKTPYESH